MSDADNQVGGSGEPFSKQDQGKDRRNEPGSAEESEQDDKPATQPRP